METKFIDAECDLAEAIAVFEQELDYRQQGCSSLASEWVWRSKRGPINIRHMSTDHIKNAVRILNSRLGEEEKFWDAFGDFPF